MVCGFFAGWIAASGYAYFSRYMNIYGVYDIVGVVNVHGIPGVLAGVFSAVFVAVYTSDVNYLKITVTKGSRSNYEQGGYQMACLGTSLGFGLVFGLITGFILSKLAMYHRDQLFEDRTFWELPTA